jgi:hypothetical protein
MRFPTELIEVDPDVYLYSSVVFASNEQLWLVMFFQHSSSYHHRCSVMLWFSIQFFLPYSLWFSNSEVSTGIRDSHDSAQVCLRLSYSEWCHRIWCVLLTDRKRSRQYLHGIMRSTGWSWQEKHQCFICFGPAVLMVESWTSSCSPVSSSWSPWPCSSWDTFTLLYTPAADPVIHSFLPGGWSISI